MHVLMLLTKPYTQDPRVHHEAQALRAAGHDVTLLQWARMDPEAPREETLDGVRVIRLSHTTLMRVLPHDVFREPFWWRIGVGEALRIHRTRPIDVVHCHDLDTLPIGARLKRRIGCPLVFDAHEVFSWMIEGNVPPPVPQAAEALERRLLPQVDLLVTASERFAEHYATRFKGPVCVVWNCFSPRPGDYVPPPSGPFTVVYIGTLSRDRLFPQLVDAIGAMPDVRFVVAGKREGAWRDVEAAAARHPNVAFLGPVPHTEVLPRTLEAHLVVTMLDPKNRQYRIQVANKMFDAMSTGRPILVSDGTYMARFVTENGIGITCPYDAAAIAPAIERLKKDPTLSAHLGHAGLALARSTFHWEAQAERLVAAYARLHRTAGSKEGTR